MHRLSDPATGMPMQTSGHSSGDVLGDARLIADLRSGSGEAYDALVDRHRHAAQLVAVELVGPDRAERAVDLALQAVLTTLLTGGGPELALRPYLLAAVVGAATSATPFVAPHDANDIWRDGSGIGSATARLPEHWQLLLWHLDVEGERPVQVGPLLGVPTSDVPDLLERARAALFAAHSGVPSTQPLGAIVLGEAAERYLAGRRLYRAPLVRRSFVTVARVPAARTAAAVTAVALIGAGAVTAAFGAAPASTPAPTGTAAHSSTVPIIPAPSDSTSAPAPADTGSDVVGDDTSPGASGSATATAKPSKKSPKSKPGGFVTGTAPSNPSTSAPTSADVGIAARAGDSSVSWTVSGLPAGASTVVTIAAESGITLRPDGDDCTGTGTARVTCTVTAGEPGGSFSVTDLTLGNGDVSLSVQPVSGLDDPEPGNNDSTVSP